MIRMVDIAYSWPDRGISPPHMSAARLRRKDRNLPGAEMASDVRFYPPIHVLRSAQIGVTGEQLRSRLPKDKPEVAGVSRDGPGDQNLKFGLCGGAGRLAER